MRPLPKRKPRARAETRGSKIAQFGDESRQERSPKISQPPAVRFRRPWRRQILPRAGATALKQAIIESHSFGRMSERSCGALIRIFALENA